MSDTTPVTEIVSFPVKEGSKPGDDQANMFGADPGDGFQNGYFGWQIEDKSILHWVLNWDSHAAHVKMMEAATYKPFIEKILEWSSGPTLYHAALKPHPPTAVFASPVSEVAKFSVTISKEEWEALFESFGAILRLAPGYRAHSGGWTVENEKDYVTVIGWDSVEAHTVWAASGPGGAAIEKIIAAVSNPQMAHMRVAGTITPNRK